MLTETEHQQLSQALRSWAERAPDEPMIGILASEKLMTPLQVAGEVADKTETGKAVLEILEHGLRREGIERVISRMTRRAATTEWHLTH